MAEVMKTVEGDEALKALMSDENYKAAVQCFRRSMRSNDPLSVEQYRALLTFYETTASVLGYYRWYEGFGTAPPRASRDDVRQAAKAAEKLVALLKKGVGYHLPFEVWTGLDTRSLERLQAALQGSATRAVAARDDATLNKREYARSLALAFLMRFDKPLKASLVHLCACVKYTPDESTIRDRIKEARAKLREREGKPKRLVFPHRGKMTDFGARPTPFAG